MPQAQQAEAVAALLRPLLAQMEMQLPLAAANPGTAGVHRDPVPFSLVE